MPVQRQPFSCVRMYVFAAKARQARWCVCSPLGRGHCSEFRLRKTLLLNAQFREAAIVDAICARQLPEWYEKEVRNGGEHLSYYAKALADGDHTGLLMEAVQAGQAGQAVQAGQAGQAGQEGVFGSLGRGLEFPRPLAK